MSHLAHASQESAQLSKQIRGRESTHRSRLSAGAPGVSRSCRFAWKPLSVLFCFDVLQAGSSLFTALGATRVASSWLIPRARDRRLTHSGLAACSLCARGFLRRHGRITHQQEDARTEGWGQTCRAILHCRTGHRGLKSTTEKLRGSELSTGGSASCGDSGLLGACPPFPLSTTSLSVLQITLLTSKPSCDATASNSLRLTLSCGQKIRVETRHGTLKSPSDCESLGSRGVSAQSQSNTHIQTSVFHLRTQAEKRSTTRHTIVKKKIALTEESLLGPWTTLEVLMQRFPNTATSPDVDRLVLASSCEIRIFPCFQFLQSTLL